MGWLSSGRWLGTSFFLFRKHFKGSVERSSLPQAIFLFLTRNRPWKSEDHLCTLFFIEMSKERLEKSERTPTVWWRPWALTYSRDRPYNFSCMSAVSKNRRFAVLFSALGCHLARKSLSWPAMQVSNKKQETRVWAAKTNQTVRWLLSACVPIRFCPEAPASSTVDVNSRFSRFQFSAFWSNGLASVSSFLLRFCYGFFIVFVYARATIRCYRFFNFDLRKKLCFVRADRVG